MEKGFFLSDEERGIDPTTGMANDCSRFQNAPQRGKIPSWWFDEGTAEEIVEWIRQINEGEAVIE